VLVSGQEDPRTSISEQGHAIALNITAPVRDTSRYYLYDSMFDGVHAQGGLTGYAHMAWAQDFYGRGPLVLHPGWDATINVPRDKVDFFEILQFRRLGLADYYDFLNLGFKLAASAGSDLPWGNTIGEVRVYAYTGSHFSADAWFAAMKRGRTFVTNGPMLTLTAGDAMPGDELAAGKKSVRARCRAWAPEIIGSPKVLEIVADGQVVRSAQSSDLRKQELQVEFDLPLERVRWIAARVVSHNGAKAHTSPIYVRTGQYGPPDRKQVVEIAGRRMKTLEFIEGRLRDPRLTAGSTKGEIQALEERIGEARAQYRKFLEPGR
jgi:hypothetical protein